MDVVMPPPTSFSTDQLLGLDELDVDPERGVLLAIRVVDHDRFESARAVLGMPATADQAGPFENLQVLGDRLHKVMPNGSASSFAVASSVANRARIARLVGSATAANVTLSSSTHARGPTRASHPGGRFQPDIPGRKSPLGMRSGWSGGSKIKIGGV
jgi:hypothetical protein